VEYTPTERRKLIDLLLAGEKEEHRKELLKKKMTVREFAKTKKELFEDDSDYKDWKGFSYKQKRNYAKHKPDNWFIRVYPYYPNLSYGQMKNLIQNNYNNDKIRAYVMGQLVGAT
jgi:hypothetical protein